MKVSKEQMAENRERILDAAAASFRERGFDGIGVADLMKDAGPRMAASTATSRRRRT